MRYLFILVTTLALTACGSVPSLQQIGQNIREVHERALKVEDEATSKAILSQTGLISYRAGTLQGLPKTVAALERACFSNNAVEILVFASELGELRKGKVRCTTVHLSDDPRLRTGDNVLLVNGQDVWVNGFAGFPSREQLAQENQYRRQVRQFALSAN